MESVDRIPHEAFSLNDDNTWSVWLIFKIQKVHYESYIIQSSCT